MLNGRTICLGVLCVFFIASMVLAQSQSATEKTRKENLENVRRKLR